MHRTRTKFAARVNRLATGLERRGVVATYELHDRLLANRASRRRFGSGPPQLDEIQQDVLERLREEGYATLPFTELVPDPGVWQELEADGARFVGRDGSRACARARGRRLGAAPTRRQGVPCAQVLVGRRARP